MSIRDYRMVRARCSQTIGDLGQPEGVMGQALSDMLKRIDASCKQTDDESTASAHILQEACNDARECTDAANAAYSAHVRACGCAELH